MRKRIIISALSAAVVTAALLVAVETPAQAHGYISSPASRQAMCAQRKTSFDCGDIVWEPQSVEAPKGSMACNGNGSRFAILNDEGRPWPATSVGNNVTFNWVLTARHRTSNWEYFVGGTRIANFNDNGAQPPASLSHSVNLGGRTGRIKVLARWNVYDTAMAFYACVDLQVGSGGPQPTTPPPTTASPTTQPPTSSPPPNPGGTWAPNTYYAVGATVTYGGLTYRCRQAHTSLPGWEPPNVAALWERI
ncbi:lytic polysaccharide monooxygenase [Catelliglobosispora koreensis]|uniref:lytic polysaccharide monooxygenase n=1 Tax=Catelliglobosispora koreensis TaxID=129052 RepID=UPI00037352B2|nr:lytic polysaccharide monooxygenase [Catelliglobosispora koreensis]